MQNMTTLHVSQHMNCCTWNSIYTIKLIPPVHHLLCLLTTSPCTTFFGIATNYKHIYSNSIVIIIIYAHKDIYTHIHFVCCTHNSKVCSYIIRPVGWACLCHGGKWLNWVPTHQFHHFLSLTTFHFSKTSMY